MKKPEPPATSCKEIDMRISIVIAVLSIASTVGCARVKVLPVANSYGSVGKTLSGDDSGIRFYRPAPHVWITSAAPPDKVNLVVDEKVEKDTTKKGMETTTTTTATVSTAGKGYTARLVMLPDYSQEYIVQWKAGIGNVTPKFTLSEGWNLTSFDSRVESRFAETLKESVGAITNLAPLAAGGLLTAPGSTFQGAGLYRLEVDARGRLALGDLVMGLE